MTEEEFFRSIWEEKKVTKPRRDELEWKPKRRRKRRFVLNAKINRAYAPYRREFRNLLWKKNNLWT